MIDIIYTGREEKGHRTDYFKFRIISLPDGTQVIDTALETPYNALTAVQMAEYTEMDVQLAIMERMRKKELREAERRRRIDKNQLYRLAYFCGLV